MGRNDMNAIRCLVIAAAAFGLLTGAAGAAGKLTFKADPDSYQEGPAISTTGIGRGPSRRSFPYV